MTSSNNYFADAHHQRAYHPLPSEPHDYGSQITISQPAAVLRRRRRGHHRHHRRHKAHYQCA